ncbi:MAG: alkaline phosphatase family protein, partial [Deltaproteobacteria bacterium]|nr:alkaline phosphatase family protein [Deltaproteobacteria bacterium]
MRLRGAIGATLILFFYGVRSPAWGENREVPATIRDVYVVLFVLDGCRADLFDQAIKAGELPTVARELVAKGATYEQALAVFPSVSPSGYQAMVSGLFPGHAGIPYLEWFDRERLRVVPFLSLRGPRNVNSSFRNFYAPEKSVSIFDDLREYPTAAVYSLFSRHAKTRLPRNVLPASIAAFLTHRLEKLDTLALRE